MAAYQQILSSKEDVPSLTLWCLYQTVFGGVEKQLANEIMSYAFPTRERMDQKMKILEEVCTFIKCMRRSDPSEDSDDEYDHPRRRRRGRPFRNPRLKRVDTKITWTVCVKDPFSGRRQLGTNAVAFEMRFCTRCGECRHKPNHIARGCPSARRRWYESGLFMNDLWQIPTCVCDDREIYDLSRARGEHCRYNPYEGERGEWAAGGGGGP